MFRVCLVCVSYVFGVCLVCDTTLAIEAEHGEWWDSVEGDSSEESLHSIGEMAYRRR